MKYFLTICLLLALSLSVVAQHSDSSPASKPATVTPSGLSILELPTNTEPQLSGNIGAVEDVLDPDQIIVFPNPATDYTNVDLPYDAQLEIRNFLGILVLQQTLSSGRNFINVSHLPTGNYNLFITKASQVVVRRFSVFRR